MSSGPPPAPRPAPSDAFGAEPPAPIMPPPTLSVVVPVRNEAPNIAPLVAEIVAALAGVSHEIIYVDDGSTDATAATLSAVALRTPTLRAFGHASSCGQSAAIISGIRQATGTWIATLDGDGQNDPADIPRLLARAEAADVDTMVAGHRVNRRDTATKRLTSRFANRLRAALLGDATPDTGCGLKVFRRSLFLELPHFDHMHRYLPALVLRHGAAVVSEPVNHRPRLRGTSNYGTLDRAIVSIADLLGMIWLQRRWKRPRATPLA